MCPRQLPPSRTGKSKLSEVALSVVTWVCNLGFLAADGAAFFFNSLREKPGFGSLPSERIGGSNTFFLTIGANDYGEHVWFGASYSCLWA